MKNNSGEIPAIEITRNGDVFIAIDSTRDQPSWVKNFTNTNSFVQNDNGIVYRVFKKKFQKGEELLLNNEAKSGGFLIMAQPASNIEPAYDLKPVDSYKAVDAKWYGKGIMKGRVDGKDRVIFQNASAENMLEWNFSVGVADKYSLTISYNNPKEETAKGKLQLLSTDGNLLKEEEIIFTPTKQGKLNYINTDTGTMINAGNYKLRLMSNEAESVSINSLEVQ